MVTVHKYFSLSKTLLVEKTLNIFCAILYKYRDFFEAMEQNIVWVDLEMTGLDINKDHIIEMACIVTDGQLNIVEEGPDIVIKQPDDLLDSMDEWCTKHHGESGEIQIDPTYPFLCQHKGFLPPVSLGMQMFAFIWLLF